MAVKMKMKTAVMTDLQKVEIQEREVLTYITMNQEESEISS